MGTSISNESRPPYFPLLALLVMFLPAVSFCQIHPETGRPFVTTFGMKETGGQFQTWAFVQDQRGVIYIGNNSGVLEYDGAAWRLIETAHNGIARSLDIDKNGRIYVGSSGDFGYLSPDAKAKLRYVSLLNLVDERERGFSYFWTVHVTNDGVYFQSRERLFRLTSHEPWKVKIWRPQGRFNYAFWVDNTYYVHQGGVGLMKMVDDSLHLLPGGEQFANDRLQVMLPFAGTEGRGIPHALMLATFSRGLFLFDGQSFRPFKTQADSYLRENTVYDGSILADGTFGLVTLSGGMVIIDHQGQALQYLNQSTGLPANSVNSIFVSHQGMVWLGPENGISVVETPSPLSRYDAASGLLGATADLRRFRGTLYASTSVGVFFLDTQAHVFRPVSGFVAGNRQSFSLVAVGKSLLVAIGTGVYEIEGARAKPVKINPGGVSYVPQFLLRSRDDTNRVFVGLFDGLASLRRASDGSGKWVDEGRIEGVHEYVVKIVEPEPGVLWLGTADNGTVRVRFNGSSTHNPSIDRFGRANGLPDGGTSVFLAGNRLVFAMKAGVFRYDKEKNTFLPDSLFNGISMGGSSDEYRIVKDTRGNIWVNFGRECAVLRPQPDGSYLLDKTALLRFADFRSTDAIYPEEDGVVWFGGAEGLLRYDPHITKDYATDYPALVRDVIVNEDSVLYAGAAIDTGLPLPVPKLPYRSNALRFEYAATSFDNPSENQFQSMLEGFDDHWSSWSKDLRKDYTNLPVGDYRFKVRARNIYQHLSNEAIYSFTILSPWYRTWFAYGVYLVALGACVYAADRLQRRRVIRRERERSRLREAELRAKAAEQLANSEGDRKKNIELLSEIGKEITSSLDFDTIFYKLYEHVNQLVDATVFGVGIYHPETEQIEYRLAVEKGKRYAPYTRDTRNKDQFPVWCIEHRQSVFINDVNREYSRYIKEYKDPRRTLEDGTLSEAPQSLIYLPLLAQERVLGVISVQSFHTNAYSDVHLNILENLAAYTSIALDNANAYRRLNATLQNLKATQEQLVAQQKLASLGALTAGIAHEIKNPLNFVNNFADLSFELVQELRTEIHKNKGSLEAAGLQGIEEVLHDLEQNAAKINEHGKRADSIVRSMLQHSRGRTEERHDIDINAMLEENLNLAYHGMRAQNSEFNIKMEKDLDPAVGKLSVVPQDISRVLLNIITNGFYEAFRKKTAAGNGFSPTLSVRTRNLGDSIEVGIRDNGNGIPAGIREKIFTPFFTTKPTGQGTGLGLSLSHDIVVKEHHGDIRFETEEGSYTEFIIRLPKKAATHYSEG